MVKYYLLEELKDSKFKIINISKIDEFSHLDYTLLKDIDTFTTMFTTKKAIKDFLIKRELIDKNAGTLCISYKYNGDNKILRSGIALYKDKDYLNYDYIMNYTKVLINDTYLLNKIYNRYKDWYVKKENLEAIIKYLNIIDNNEKVLGTDRYDVHMALIRLFKEDLLKYKSGNINYRALHDLGITISNYDKKKVKTKNKDNQINMFD